MTAALQIVSMWWTFLPIIFENTTGYRVDTNLGQTEGHPGEISMSHPVRETLFKKERCHRMN